ncbi:DUF3592 domain-containing protein [Nakamurella sp.]|uniref:DUF3592 domain-containing protein n=1 Tax=Nakamurella sp. TaxID=1869182 RepID=UPI003B3A23F3
MTGGLAIPLWAGVAVLAAGGVFVVIGVLTTTADRRRRRAWRPVTGVVVGSRLDGDGHQRCQVEYPGPDGRPVRFWNRFTTAGGADRTGQTVAVLVNPADPQDAVVSAGAASGRLVGSAFLAFGAVAEVAGVLLVVAALS